MVVGPGGLTWIVLADDRDARAIRRWTDRGDASRQLREGYRLGRFIDGDAPGGGTLAQATHPGIRLGVGDDRDVPAIGQPARVQHLPCRIGESSRLAIVDRSHPRAHQLIA